MLHIKLKKRKKLLKTRIFIVYKEERIIFYYETLFNKNTKILKMYSQNYGKNRENNKYCSKSYCFIEYMHLTCLTSHTSL